MKSSNCYYIYLRRGLCGCREVLIYLNNPLKVYRVLEPMAEIYKQIRSLIEEDRCGMVKKGMRIH